MIFERKPGKHNGINNLTKMEDGESKEIFVIMEKKKKKFLILSKK